jgi:hypothetical protein
MAIMVTTTATAMRLVTSSPVARMISTVAMTSSESCEEFKCITWAVISAV